MAEGSEGDTGEVQAEGQGAQEPKEQPEQPIVRHVIPDRVLSAFLDGIKNRIRLRMMQQKHADSGLAQLRIVPTGEAGTHEPS